jgi:hypothetical protein
MTKYDRIDIDRCYGCDSTKITTVIHRAYQKPYHLMPDLEAYCSMCIVGVIDRYYEGSFEMTVEEARLLVIKSRL